METVATGTATDPVCGMKVDPSTAAHHSTWNGETYHFCSAACKAKFEGGPAPYIDSARPATPSPPPAFGSQSE